MEEILGTVLIYVARDGSAPHLIKGINATLFVEAYYDLTEVKEQESWDIIIGVT